MLTLFAVNKNEDNECWALKNADYRLGFDIGFFIAHGLIFPLLMSTFGFLTICNIRRQQRYSDQQNGTSNLRRYRVRDFRRMTLVQTACAIIFILPYVIQKLHRTVTDSDCERPEEVAWERLSLCIVRVLCVDLLHAFYGLNYHFNFLLYEQYRSYRFIFYFISKYNFDIICSQHLPFIVDRIIDLSLSDRENTPGQINLLLSYIPSFSQFTQLRSLSIFHLHSYNILMKIVNECHHLNHQIFNQLST
ncbi:unnamed protein product [Rotaria sp. Silwood2]|nr:unnamed protein product [Rotaria sp. Silwood2]